jgi:Flp pilus assembly protein TadD
MTAGRPTPSLAMRIALGAAVVALTLAALWTVTGNDFINLDDGIYIQDNDAVRQGLTMAGLRFAFTSTAGSNWHPLTWLSHMLDVQLFGLNPGMHHLMGLLIHALNTGLLFAVLAAATGSVWPSAFVAALFGVHPLHVESVAWASERKDLLAGLFWILGLGAWVRYARHPSAGRYAAAAACLILGLLSKPMAVTLPFVFLLMDWWPLGRWNPAGAAPAPFRDAAPRNAARLLIEKVPLLLLSAAGSAVTWWAQKGAGSAFFGESLPLGVRLANALASAGRYLVMTVWPAGLAVFYPHPGTAPPFPVWGGALLFLLAATLGALRAARNERAVAMGWFLYLGTLVPVIGIVQVGSQAMADRYTYLPLIGVFIALAWGGMALVGRFPAARLPLAALATASVIASAALAHVQAGYWKDSERIFSRAQAVTRRNWTAENGLGIVLAARGDLAGAIARFRRAIEYHPRYPEAWFNLGAVSEALGRRGEAVEAYRAAVRIFASYTAAQNSLATALVREGRLDDAIVHYRASLKAFPPQVMTRVNLGHVLALTGDLNGAETVLREAVALDPSVPEVWTVLGNVLAAEERTDEASAAFREALRIRPGDSVAQAGLESIIKR